MVVLQLTLLLRNIPLNDKRHPVLQLEKWPEEESVRGVAGGVTVKLVGSVVFRITMYRKGTSEGPEVRIRFKITQAGSTDWVCACYRSFCSRRSWTSARGQWTPDVDAEYHDGSY